MKRLQFAALLMLLVTLFCSAAAAEIRNSPDGFRGIKWGQAPSALGENAQILWLDDLKIASKADDELKIGNAVLTSIRYCFWEDQLLYVMLSAKGPDNAEALKSALVERHGEPEDASDETMLRYIWIDKNATIQFTHEKDDSSTVIMLSAQIMAEYNKKLNAKD